MGDCSAIVNNLLEHWKLSYNAGKIIKGDGRSSNLRPSRLILGISAPQLPLLTGDLPTTGRGQNRILPESRTKFLP